MSERRRMMMAGGDKYISYLKSMGCVNYFPLDNGDLQDKITGNLLTLTGNGSMTWDSSKGMYQFTTPNVKNSYIASFQRLYTNQYTMFATVCKANDGDGQYQIIGYSNWVPALYNSAMQYWVRFYPTSPTLLTNIIVANDYYKVYYGDELKTTGQAGNIDSNNILTIGLTEPNGKNSTFNRSFWLKDIYVFNVALTIEEVYEVISKK